MSRTFLLSLILLGLLGVAFYMYPGTIQDYTASVLQPLLEMAGLGSPESGESGPSKVSTGETTSAPQQDSSVAQNSKTVSPEEKNSKGTQPASSEPVESSETHPDSESLDATGDFVQADTDQTVEMQGNQMDESKPTPETDQNEANQSSSSVVSASRPEEKSDDLGSTRAMKGSGETIRYSKIGRFPISNPPEGYQGARRAYENGNFREARSLLEDLIKTYPNSANTNYLLGAIYFEQGQFDEARPYFQKASSLDHDPQIKSWSREYLKRIDKELRG